MNVALNKNVQIRFIVICGTCPEVGQLGQMLGSEWLPKMHLLDLLTDLMSLKVGSRELASFLPF